MRATIAFVTVLAIQILEGEGQVMHVVVRGNIENELTTAHLEVVGREGLDEFEFLTRGGIFLTLTDNVHTIDIRAQGL